MYSTKWLPLLCLFSCAFSKADELPSIAEVFKGKSTVIVDQLIAQGHKELKAVNLEDLRSRAPEIVWRAYNGEKLPAGILERGSAYYLKNSKTVTVMTDIADYSPDSVNVLALHESLGALGIKDENYQTSLGMYLLAGARSDSAKKRLKESIQFLGGSGTSVTGGGDLTALSIKLKIWDRLKIYEIKISEFLAFASQSFEPNRSVTESEVRIHPSILSKSGIEIRLPVNVWKNGDPEEMERVLSQTVTLVNILNGINPEFTWFGRLHCQGLKWPANIYLSALDPESTLDLLKKSLMLENCQIDRTKPSSETLLQEFLEQRSSSEGKEP